MMASHDFTRLLVAESCCAGQCAAGTLDKSHHRRPRAISCCQSPDTLGSSKNLIGESRLKRILIAFDRCTNRLARRPGTYTAAARNIVCDPYGFSGWPGSGSCH
jgi:hypothetical protein